MPFIRTFFSLIGAALVALCAPERYSVPADTTIFEVVQGTWDWADGDSTCLANPHTISFTADTAYMLLTYARPDSTGARPVYTYEIWDHSPSTIQGFIIDETRRTPAGELVVWDLMLTSSDSYVWHRTDWPSTSYTPSVIRCSDPAAYLEQDSTGTASGEGEEP